MKVDVTTVNSFQKRLVFEIPPEQVRTKLDQAYKQLAGQVRLAGFRPGKAPRRVLEAKFGERVEADVANDLIQHGYQNALSDHDIQPVGRPNLSESGQVTKPEGFQFTITVDVRPEIDLGSWTGLDVVYPTVEVASDEIDRTIRARLEGQARIEEVSDRAVAPGDMALVELVVRDGEEEIAREPGTMIRTEADPYYPGIESLVIGLGIGEEKQGKVSFSEKARVEQVAGRELDTSVKVISIQSYRVPDLDDEVANNLGYEGGAAGMRTAIESQLRQGREEMARNQARANLLEAIIAKNPFDVPAGMVEQSLGMLMDELRMQQSLRTGRDPRTIGFSDAQVRDLRIRSEFAAKAGLILEWVAKREGIAVEDADVDSKYKQLAAERGQTVEAVKGWFKKEEATTELRERILEEKTLDWLLERSNLVAPSAAPASSESAPSESAPSESTASGELSILDGTVDALKEALASGSLDASLDALLAAESGARNRKGALGAIEARQKELTGG